MTDDELIAGFESCNSANESFHHADHVRMAFLYVSRYPAAEAIQRFSSALARFAAANGKPKLYNETITWAFLLLIRERLARAGRPQTLGRIRIRQPGSPELEKQHPEVLLSRRNPFLRPRQNHFPLP